MANEDINTQNDIEHASVQEVIDFLAALDAKMTIVDRSADKVYGAGLLYLTQRGDEAFSIDNYHDALHYYIRAYDLGADLLANGSNNFALVAGSFLCAKMANVYIKLGDYEKAAMYYNRAQIYIKNERGFIQDTNLTFKQKIKHSKLRLTLFLIITFMFLALVCRSFFPYLLDHPSPLLFIVVAELIVLGFWAGTFEIARSAFRK